MFLAVGLGNPGSVYRRNRHNAGHIVMDLLGPLDGFVLIKTTVYMNNSGEEIKRIVDDIQLPSDHLVVVHDDVGFQVGRFRIQKGKGSNRHKGVQSIIDRLGKNFWRVRIGIGRPMRDTTTESHVLTDFTEDELGVLRSIVPEIRAQLTQLS